VRVWNIVGIDIAAPYIGYASTRSKDPRLSFLTGDAVALDLVFEQVRDRVPDSFEDLGDQQVKNIAHQVRERRSPVLNAIVVWQVEQARERARAADASFASGERWGPVHGIPMTVKESFNLAGLPSIHDEPSIEAL
jgi:hypothetical protein